MSLSLSAESAAGLAPQQEMFGANDGTVIHAIDNERGVLTLRLLVEDHHIGTGGTLDEGLVATLADNYTTYVLVGHSLALRPEHMPISVSVCLSAQALAPIRPGTLIDIVCRVTNAELDKPHATAVFQDSQTRTVYAVASQTKHVKDVLGYHSPSSSGGSKL
ncbi:hypothetical protein IWW38_000378 [Coemansia aciculifera]|uniref:Uncharacterized protein n=1 Tax=Coemansia aciculifera TaxID=417176 RepID=A0ACC1M9Q5_9FUNG|nr:hypothetical protein IWW38_000378 [Coemansia aciculifera]